MAAKKKRTRAAKSPLTVKKIFRQALRIADKGGIEALSMRKLADRLGVEAMSLYNHVQNKDDVLDGVLTLVVEQFQIADPEKEWRQALRESAISTHLVLLKHPWAAQLLISRVNTSAAMMKYSEAGYGCLYKAGFSYVLADHAWNAIGNHIYGFTLTQINSPVDTRDYAKAAKQYLPQVPVDEYPHIHGMMQLIISGQHNGINNFEFGLDLILDGLARLKASS